MDSYLRISLIRSRQIKLNFVRLSLQVFTMVVIEDTQAELYAAPFAQARVPATAFGTSTGPRLWYSLR